MAKRKNKLKMKEILYYDFTDEEMREMVESNNIPNKLHVIMHNQIVLKDLLEEVLSELNKKKK